MSSYRREVLGEYGILAGELAALIARMPRSRQPTAEGALLALTRSVDVARGIRRCRVLEQALSVMGDQAEGLLAFIQRGKATVH